MNTLECRKTHVIACDLDDSLVATRRRSEQVRRASDAALSEIRGMITDLRRRGETIYFGSATGRTFTSVQELADQRPAFGDMFPITDFHITSVGGAIYKAVYKPGRGFSYFARVPGWPDVSSWNRAAFIDRLATHPDLTPQEPIAQDEHKLSYITTSGAETTLHATQLGSYLGAVGLQANVIVSGASPQRFVDILPARVSKGSALLQLPQLIGGYPEGPVCRVAAGDSMNDQALLAAADVAIIPSNGQPDLLEWAASREPANAPYLASEPFAAGVLQGLQRHLCGEP